MCKKLDDGSYSVNKNVFKVERTSSIQYSKWGILKLQTHLMTVPSNISDTSFHDFIKYQLLELQTNSMMVHC